MPTFRLKMDGKYVRLIPAEDVSLDWPLNIKYAMTFDETNANTGDVNPIAQFTAEGRRLKESTTGFYLHPTNYRKKGVLVTSSTSFLSMSRWELEVRSPGTVRVRNITNPNIVRYLGAGTSDFENDCPAIGIVRQVSLSSGGPNDGVWCTRLDFELETDSSSDYDAILRQLASVVSCETDAECAVYGSRAMVCVDGACGMPDPVPCEWEWEEWTPCESTASGDYMQTAGWYYTQEPKFGGHCDNPPPEFRRTSLCMSGIEGPIPNQPLNGGGQTSSLVPEPAAPLENPMTWIWNPFADGFFDAENMPLWIYVGFLVIVFGFVFQ